MGAPDTRELADLVSIGTAMLQDFQLLGVRSVADLARRDPLKLYQTLCTRTGVRQDPCVLDTFCAAVAQARNPKLPREQCNWWHWSRRRLAVTAQSARKKRPTRQNPAPKQVNKRHAAPR